MLPLYSATAKQLAEWLNNKIPNAAPPVGPFNKLTITQQTGLEKNNYKYKSINLRTNNYKIIKVPRLNI